MQADPVVATPIDARPAAIVNGRTIGWGDLRAALTEAAGAEILEERILDEQITRALASGGIVLIEDDRLREQALLLQSLSDDPNTAVRLLDELRTRRGLGPSRYAALLARNAGLRALVQPRVIVSAEAIRRMYELAHGPKRQARLITVATAREAEALRQRVIEGEAFADLGVAHSTDASAARGGLLEPISRVDSSYPDVLRQTLFSLQPQAVSVPILLDRQYALLQHVRTILEPDAPPLAEVSEEMERLARLEQERLLMDDFARRLLMDVAVNIYDRSLEDAWERRRGR